MSPRRANPEADKRGMKSWFFITKHELDLSHEDSDFNGSLAMEAVRLLNGLREEQIIIDDIIKNSVGIGIVDYRVGTGRFIGTYRIEYLGETYEAELTTGEGGTEREMNAMSTDDWNRYKAEKLGIEYPLIDGWL